MTAEIKRLEVYCQQLGYAIEELEHELRRCADAAERGGDGSLQKRVSELRRNLNLNVAELEQARSKIAVLKK